MDFQTDTPLLQAVMIGYEFGRRKMLDESVGVRIKSVNSHRDRRRAPRNRREYADHPRIPVKLSLRICGIQNANP